MRYFWIAFCLASSFNRSEAKAADYYTTIRPIIESKCLHCHSGKGVSFAFGDLDGAYAFRAAMTNAVAQRRMPPWMAAPGVQKYQHDLSLTAEDFAAFAHWGKANFPLGDKRKYRAQTAPLSVFKSDVSLLVPGSEDFLPEQSARDDYRCFLAPWPLKTPMYVRGIEVVPGNLRIAHHAILYVVDEKYATSLRAMDAEEKGAGYKCFGGPLPDRFGDPTQAAIFEKRFPKSIKEIQEHQFWLAHWAPGMSGYVLPKDTGMLVNPKSMLIVQMHYYTGFAMEQRDPGMKINFQLAKSVLKPAFNWPLTEQKWLNSTKNNSLIVPPMQSQSVSTEGSLANLDAYLAALSGVPKDQITGLEVHSANIHMHLIGASGEVTLIGPEGSEALLKVPRYEFGWQRDFMLVKPKIIPKEALAKWKIRVRCTFTNPNTEPVYGGFGSDQEMCYNFSLISISRKAH